MQFSDIIALAKQGYTPKDIRDLLDLTVDGTEHKPPEEDGPEEAEIDGSDEQKDHATQDVEEVLDYKALYEESKHKIEDLTKQLESSQKKNVKENMQGDIPKNQDIINDLARSFM